jgi:hypothetical protein
MQHNLNNQQKNQHLTDLLAPVNSQYIENFREKVIQEHQEILNTSMDRFS